LVDFDIDMLFI